MSAVSPTDGGATAVEGVTVSSVLLAKNATPPADNAFAPLAVLSDNYPVRSGFV